MNINLINSVAKAYKARGATLVTKEGAAALAGGLMTGISRVAKGVREAKRKLQKNLAYKQQDFTDLDLQQPQIDQITKLYDQYNQGAKMATSIFRGKDFKDEGIEMMNTAKQQIDKLYESLTKFGTTLNFIKNNNMNRSESSDLLSDGMYTYMVDNYDDFMSNVKIEEETMRAFVEFDDPEDQSTVSKIYLDEIEQPSLIAREDIKQFYAMNPAKIVESSMKGLPKEEVKRITLMNMQNITDVDTQNSLIFDAPKSDFGKFVSYLVTDASFKAKIETDNRFKLIKTAIDEYNQGDKSLDATEDLFETVSDDLKRIIKSSTVNGETVPAYNLYQDLIEFQMQEFFGTDGLYDKNFKDPNAITPTKLTFAQQQQQNEINKFQNDIIDTSKMYNIPIPNSNYFVKKEKGNLFSVVSGEGDFITNKQGEELYKNITLEQLFTQFLRRDVPKTKNFIDFANVNRDYISEANKNVSNITSIESLTKPPFRFFENK